MTLLERLIEAVGEAGAGTATLVRKTSAGMWTVQIVGGAWDAPVFVAAEVHPDLEWAIRAAAVSWLARTQVTKGTPTVARDALIRELTG